MIEINLQKLSVNSNVARQHLKEILLLINSELR